MFCSNCGSEIKSNSKFCGRCGSPATDSNEAGEQGINSLMPTDAALEVEAIESIPKPSPKEVFFAAAKEALLKGEIKDPLIINLFLRGIPTLLDTLSSKSLAIIIKDLSGICFIFFKQSPLTI